MTPADPRRPFAQPTTSDSVVPRPRSTVDRERPERAAALDRETHGHARGDAHGSRGWNVDAENEDDVQTDVRARDRDLIDETEDRE